MAAAAILKIRKIAIRDGTNDFDENLVQWCVWDPQIPASNKKFTISKIQDGGGRHKMAAAAILKNRKILISLQPIYQFITKFGMLMRLAILDSNSE